MQCRNRGAENNLYLLQISHRLNEIILKQIVRLPRCIPMHDSFENFYDGRRITRTSSIEAGEQRMQMRDDDTTVVARLSIPPGE